MLPRASVVIPTFQRPKATLRAVRSALAQSIGDIEIIVVDDGSEDETAQAIESLGEERVIVLKQDRRRGACAARNRGIQAARAPFIALLDSDDEMLPNSLQRRIEALEAHPDSPFVYSRVHYALSKRIRLVVPEQPLRPRDSFIDALIVRQGLATSAMLARADALRACPFDERLSGVDDWDVALKLARMGPVSFVEEPLSIIHAENEGEGGRITFDFDPQSEHRLIELHREEFDASPKAEAVVLYKLAMRAVKLGNRDLASEYLRRTCRLDSAHKKARVVMRISRLGFFPLLPLLLRLRWKFLLATGWIKKV